MKAGTPDLELLNFFNRCLDCGTEYAVNESTMDKFCPCGGDGSGPPAETAVSEPAAKRARFSDTLTPASSGQAVNLMATREVCARHNNRMLAKIGRPGIYFKASDSLRQGTSSSRRAKLPSQLDQGAPSSLELRVEARVLITRVLKVGSSSASNDAGSAMTERVLAPGAVGTVTRLDTLPGSCDSTGCAVYVEFDRYPGTAYLISAVTFDIACADDPSAPPLASRQQVPLILGYAVTMARSQGLTLDKVIVDFSASDWSLPAGMAYVALSRCRRRRDMKVIGLKSCHLKADAMSVAFEDGLAFY